MEMSAKPARIFTTATSQAMVSGETGDGLIRNGRQRGWIERKVGRQPGVLRQRQHVAERRALSNAARDKVSGLEREFRSAPALRQGGERAPIGGVVVSLCLACAGARPGQQQPVA